MLIEVIDHEGRPLERANVALYLVAKGGVPHPVRTFRTDKNGRHELPDLERRAVSRLDLAASTFSVSHQGLGMAAPQRVPRPQPMRGGLMWRLQPPKLERQRKPRGEEDSKATLSVTVTDSAGPVAGAAVQFKVTAGAAPPELTTNAEGSARTGADPVTLQKLARAGAMSLPDVRKGGHRLKVLDRAITEDREDLFAMRVLVERARVTPEAVPRILIRVIDEAGAPVSDVDITLTIYKGEDLVFGATSSQGRTELALPSVDLPELRERYRPPPDVRRRDQALRVIDTRVVRDTAQEFSLVAQVQLPSRPVIGQLRGPQGRAVSADQVTLHVATQSDSSVQAVGATNPQGQFQLDLDGDEVMANGPGAYKIEVARGDQVFTQLGPPFIQDRRRVVLITWTVEAERKPAPPPEPPEVDVTPPTQPEVPTSPSDTSPDGPTPPAEVPDPHGPGDRPSPLEPSEPPSPVDPLPDVPDVDTTPPTQPEVPTTPTDTPPDGPTPPADVTDPHGPGDRPSPLEPPEPPGPPDPPPEPPEPEETTPTDPAPTQDTRPMTDTGKQLFRFQAVRPVKQDAAIRHRIEVQGEPTDFMVSLREAQEPPQVRALAKAYHGKADFFAETTPERGVFGPVVGFMNLLSRIDRTAEFAEAKAKVLDLADRKYDISAVEKLVGSAGEIWDHYLVACTLKDTPPEQRASLSDCLRATLVVVEVHNAEDWASFDKIMAVLPIVPDWLVRAITGRLQKAFPYVAGFTDLMVVKEDWARYERGEIAHIENVMSGETRSRTLRKLDSTTVTSTVEFEETKEKSKESSQSIHNAVASEIENTIATDTGLATGITVSGKYGPAVKVDATASFDFNVTTEETRASSEEYAQDMVERASSKVTTRQRNETVTVLLSESEDTAVQEFSNGGAEHMAGVYRYVDQIWKAQILNYGLRMMLDLVVPEPAVTWRASQVEGAIPDTTHIPPPPLDIEPADITDGGPVGGGLFGVGGLGGGGLGGILGSGGLGPLGGGGNPTPPAPGEEAPLVLNPNTYSLLAALHGATDMPAPPEKVVYVQVAEKMEVPSRGGNEANSTSQMTGQLTIPEGYEANRIYATLDALNYNNNNNLAQFFVNGEVHDFNDGDDLEKSLSDATGMMQYGVYLNNKQGGLLSVKVRCAISDKAWRQWQLDAYAALHRAHSRATEAFEAKRKQSKTLALVQQETMHPAAKRIIERNELKRAAISILASDNFEARGAISDDSDDRTDIPAVNFEDAYDQGAYARFFEEAFEWDEMTYLYYPYFWARQSQWYALLHERDPDTLFENFLRSGSARVNLAVRRGFEGAVLWFMATGEIWSGGPVPGIGDPLYVSLIDEIASSKGLSHDKPVPVGDPWEYSMPTSLVILDPDDSLIPPSV